MRDPLQMHDMQSIYLKIPDDVSAVVIGSAIGFLQFAEKTMLGARIQGCFISEYDRRRVPITSISVASHGANNTL